MNQGQQQGNGAGNRQYQQNQGNQTPDNRQYQYEEKKEVQKQSVPNREFKFTFGQKQDIPKKLKMPRSTAYIEAVKAADLLTANDEAIIARLKENMDEEAVEELSEMTAEELAEEIKNMMREELADTLSELKENHLIGVLAQCYIAGCDVHAIDSEGNILDHFETNRVLPEGLEAGRKVFHKYKRNCSCVEVYTNYCLVIGDDGGVTQVPWR